MPSTFVWPMRRWPRSRPRSISGSTRTSSTSTPTAPAACWFRAFPAAARSSGTPSRRCMRSGWLPVPHGYHYRWADGAWRDTRSGEEFFAALSVQASAQGGRALRFEAPHGLDRHHGTGPSPPGAIAPHCGALAPLSSERNRSRMPLRSSSPVRGGPSSRPSERTPPPCAFSV